MKETAEAQTVGDVMKETSIGTGAQALLIAILQAQSTTELKRRRNISDDAYGLCAARGDFADAEIYREMSIACSDIIAGRIIFRLTPGGGTEALYTEWQHGEQVQIYKHCMQPWCISHMINRQLAVTMSGKRVGYNSCPTHRAENATMLEDAYDPFMWVGPKAGEGALRRKEIRSSIKVEAAALLARLNKEVQL